MGGGKGQLQQRQTENLSDDGQRNNTHEPSPDAMPQKISVSSAAPKLKCCKKINYAEWLAALQDTWIVEDAEWVLNEVDSAPADTSDRHNIKLKAAVKTLIRKLLHNQIRSELSFETMVGDTVAMMAAIEKLFVTNNEETHRRLKNDAKMLRLKLGKCINDYMVAHRDIRCKMYQVVYPNIVTEVKTIRFVVNGLTWNPKYRDAVGSLPNSLGILQDRLLEE